MYSFFAEGADFANIGLQKEDVFFYTVTDSTNTRAREAFLASPTHQKRLFIAREQTAGRGTRGRSFESKVGGIYFSLLFVPDAASYDPASITARAAAAVYEALCEEIGRRHSKKMLIKWVNDIYLYGKKICGILSESINKDGAVGYVIGIGINLYGDDFSPEVSKIAASVEAMTGVRPDEGRLLYGILSRLIPSLESPRSAGLIRSYKRHSLRRGTSITVTDSHSVTRGARVIGIDRDLHLKVRYDNGEAESLISGDVGIRI